MQTEKLIKGLTRLAFSFVIWLTIFAGMISAGAIWPDPPEGEYSGGWLGKIFNLNESGTGKLVLKSTKIGIGTNTPNAKLEVVGNIIANTPIQDNHVATKAYVDASENTNSTKLTLDIKFTQAQYNGNLGGITWGNQKCNNEYIGYNMCDEGLIIKHGRTGGLPNPGSYYNNTNWWFYWSQICNNYSESFSYNFGSILQPFVSSTYKLSLLWSSAGNSQNVSSCNVETSIACCKEL